MVVVVVVVMVVVVVVALVVVDPTSTRAAAGDLRGDAPAALRRVEQRPAPALPPQPLAAQHRARRVRRPRRRRRSRTRLALAVRRWSVGPGRHSTPCRYTQ